MLWSFILKIVNDVIFLDTGFLFFKVENGTDSFAFSIREDMITDVIHFVIT